MYLYVRGISWWLQRIGVFVGPWNRYDDDVSQMGQELSPLDTVLKMMG